MTDKQPEDAGATAALSDWRAEGSQVWVAPNHMIQAMYPAVAAAVVSAHNQQRRAQPSPPRAVTQAQVEACFTAMRAGKPLWRCISACREYEKVHGQRRECMVCQVDRLEAAVLRLFPADAPAQETTP